MRLTNKVILVASNEPWGDIWYSKQNYAFELSRTNTVIFIDPPTQWTVSNLFRISPQLIKQTNSLIILRYGNYIPVRINFLNRINNFLVSRKLRRKLRQNAFEPDMFWTFDPMRLYQPKLLGVKTSIYHCVDYYYFQFYGEKQLCENSSVIFATSQLFLNEFSQFDTPKYIVPHGISEDEFNIDPLRAREIDIKHKDFGLYIGVVDPRMDFEMYEKVIQTFPEKKFVFVGPIRLTDNESAQRIFAEQKYSNVILAGPKHFKDLKYYVNASSFCISFMDMDYHPNTVHHHKTLVYLAQGKPVFSFAYEEYKQDPDVMYMSNDQGVILNLLDQFIKEGESDNKKNNRLSYSKRYLFENVLDKAGNYLTPYI